MFENFSYSPEQIKKYHQAAVKDLRLITREKAPEMVFYVSYNVLIKAAMAVTAKNNLRVKSRVGHHIELIHKLAEILRNPEIEDAANRMRSKRNHDLYGGGVAISQKEAHFYLSFCKNLMKQVDSYLFPNKLL